MAEGPVSFGKPIFFLILVGMAGGGYWAYKNWPSHYEGQGWTIDWPNKWECAPFPDPAEPANQRVAAKGPLGEEGSGEGVGWVTVNLHGTLDWPTFAHKKVPGTIDWSMDDEIDHKKTLIFTYEDNNIRYIGSAVQRGDAVVVSAIGCVKPYFDANKPRFEKCVRSLRVSR